MHPNNRSANIDLYQFSRWQQLPAPGLNQKAKIIDFLRLYGFAFLFLLIIIFFFWMDIYLFGREVVFFLCYVHILNFHTGIAWKRVIQWSVLFYFNGHSLPDPRALSFPTPTSFTLQVIILCFFFVQYQYVLYLNKIK